MTKTILWGMMVAALALPGFARAEADGYCGKLYTNHYGPFDYRTDKGKLRIVEQFHFTDEVENGITGSSGTLGGDIDYTLQASPNHHRALMALARIALRDKTLQLPGAKYPVECYFERAYRFAPDDGIARAAYGAYLFGLGKYDRALAVYKQAHALAPDDPMINYNLGLAYLKMNDYEHALQHAHQAYDQGYPLPGLKNQLVKAGKWIDQPVKDKAP